MKKTYFKTGILLIAGILALSSCGGAEDEVAAESTTVSVMSTITFDYKGQPTGATVVEAIDNFTSEKDMKVIEGNKLIAVSITMSQLSSGQTDFDFATTGYQLVDKAGKKYSLDGIATLKLSDAYDGEMSSVPQNGFLYFQVPSATDMTSCSLELSDSGKSLGSIALKAGEVKETTRSSDAVMEYDDFGRIIEIKCSEITAFIPTKDEYNSAKGLHLLRIKASLTNKSTSELTMRSSSLQLGSKFYTGAYMSNASDAPQFESTKIAPGETVEAVFYFDVLPGDSDFKLLSYEQEVAL